MDKFYIYSYRANLWDDVTSLNVGELNRFYT